VTDELERIERRSGTAIVVRGDDIDTDRIIPARFMKAVTFEGIGEHVFADARFTADGVPKDHPFNEERFRSASILVVNRNFGCGSSREHAPQALHGWGIRAIVGESFAEIFFGNCVALGLPVVTAAHEDVMALMDAAELDPSGEITVDLAALTVTSRVGTVPVRIPEGSRRQLREGTWDASRTLLQARDRIRETAARIPYIAGF
jgi:3-isopropylmalate/(R)-2-methylmalate dehydratase small subunit